MKRLVTFNFSYVIMENLRHLLYQYRSKTALFLGHRMAFGEDKLEEGYMAGKKL